MIEVSNVNFTDTDVDALMKSTDFSFPIYINIYTGMLASSLVYAYIYISSLVYACI